MRGLDSETVHFNNISKRENEIAELTGSDTNSALREGTTDLFIGVSQDNIDPTI